MTRTDGGATATRTAPAGGPGAGAGLGGAARQSFANLVGVGLAAVAGFGLNIVITRGWSVREAGMFFAATSAFMIAASAARLGTDVGTVYFVSRYRALDQRERIRGTVLAGLLPVLAVGALLGLAGWLSAPALAAATMPEAGPDAVTALRILLAFVPLAALNDYALAACRGFGQMRPLLTVERLGRTLVQFVAVAVAAWLGLSATSALPLAWAVPYLLAAAVAVVWLGRLVRRAGRRVAQPVPVGELAGPFWRFTGPRALSSLAAIVVQRLDIVLLSALRGPADAAVYTAATRFLALGQLSSVALSSSVQHRLAAAFARDDRAEARQLYQAATGWLVLLAWPAYLVFAAFAGPMLALFGSGYGAGRPVVLLLALTMLVATGCGMVDMVLNMAGRTAWTFYNAMAGTVLNVVANVALIPVYGILGAALAWTASILVTNLVPLGQLWWSLRLHPFGRGTRAAMALAVGCFGLPLGAASLLGAPVPVLAGLTVVGAAAYLAGAWRWRAALHLDALRALRRGRKSTGATPAAQS
ncbi:polysaccharide biosynthesis C-terminal domain-containing protein [Micromonospora sp. DR5-3]|uniref:MATE family efflux transporter n=1 Tax=unclassified Micromonospora TaxID=2617518 RepID=UPI002101DC49|nr:MULTISPECIES: polysaccharide biosynthesis C-terminal domain-containing protein [unclassified Micromonospora]MCW3816510.1 polysaccharide biosynthesis C-terminal domain-containing protein [Micromonospora sp. DR5-3]